MKKSFKKLAALFSLGILGTYGLIFACADGFWGYDYDSSFTPETYVDKSYAPLFFSTNDVFYGIGFDGDYTGRFNDIIVSDWSNYLQSKISPRDLTYLLLNDSATSTINQLTIATKGFQSLPTRFSKLNLLDEKTKKFIEFMGYAKVIEASCTVNTDSWNYVENSKSAVDPKIILEVEKLYENTSDAFLKNRYWFQTLKGHFYSKNKQNVITFFDKTKDATPKNVLYYRGLSYVAGTHYHNKNYATSNYFYSMVFDGCPELRTVAMYDFHPMEVANFQASLALTKTNNEKAALWALNGYYADEKEAILEIYKLNPSNAHLEFLLTRLVNKEEVKLNNNVEFKSAIEYLNYIRGKSDKGALELVTTIAKEGKTSKPYLWNLAAGYLNIFSGNSAQTDEFFATVERLGPKTPLAGNQLRLLKLINVLFNTTTLDETTQRKLLPELTWLYNYTSAESENTFRYHHALEWSKRYIASLYQAQQNPVLAELFKRNDEFYRAASNLEAMKLFLQKPGKSPWEQLAIKIYNVTLSDIFEYQAVMNAYAGSLDNAISFMTQSDNGKKIILPGNPFNGNIQDCHDCDHASKQRVTYTKLSVLEKMREMKGHVDKEEDIYNNGLLLGNAYYNMTYFGNARTFYYGSIINQSGNSIATYYQPQLLNCSVAKQYYQKAFEAATTAEQKAKCVYLMAKCERNDFYTQRYHSKGDFYGDTDIDFQAWPGFKKLKAEYANTNYYKEVIKECGYFKQYVEK